MKYATIRLHSKGFQLTSNKRCFVESGFTPSVFVGRTEGAHLNFRSAFRIPQPPDGSMRMLRNCTVTLAPAESS